MNWLVEILFYAVESFVDSVNLPLDVVEKLSLALFALLTTKTFSSSVENPEKAWRWEELVYVKQNISSPQNIKTYLNRGGVGLIPEGCVGCRLHWRYHPFRLLFQEIYLKLQINDEDWTGFQHFNSFKSITNNTGHRSQVLLPSTGW